MDRNEVIQEVKDAEQRIIRNDSIELRDQIARTTKYLGYFEIWQNVFQKDSDMLRRLDYVKNQNKGE